MTSGLLAPLGPPEEITLRRIALGSFVVDAQAASTLIALALVQRTGSGLRLTPLGRLRYNALPKAALLRQQRSIHAMTGYVEGLIEKAQIRATAAKPEVPKLASLPGPTHLLPETEDEAHDEQDGPDQRSIYRPIYFYFDSEQWKSRAESALALTRQSIMEHRRRQVRLCDASDSRIVCSRSLLKDSVPIRPSWLAAAN